MTVDVCTVRRIAKTSRSGFINEHWTADTSEDIQRLFEQEQRRYPTRGYGTEIYDVHQDPTGLIWHAEFVRYTSCD